jgi:hypothetical protein
MEMRGKSIVCQLLTHVRTTEHLTEQVELRNTMKGID